MGNKSLLSPRAEKPRKGPHGPGALSRYLPVDSVLLEVKPQRPRPCCPLPTACTTWLCRHVDVRAGTGLETRGQGFA